MDLQTKPNLLNTLNQSWQSQKPLMKYIFNSRFAACYVTFYTNLLQNFSIVGYEVLECHHLTAFQVHSNTRIKISNSIAAATKTSSALIFF